MRFASPPGASNTTACAGVPGALTDGQWTAHFRKTGAKWNVADPAADDVANTLRKCHVLQGPIDDAFMDAFLSVRPSGTPMNETVGKWTQSGEEHAAKLWPTQMRGDAPTKDDTAIPAAGFFGEKWELLPNDGQ